METMEPPSPLSSNVIQNNDEDLEDMGKTISNIDRQPKPRSVYINLAQRLIQKQVYSLQKTNLLATSCQSGFRIIVIKIKD
jgi:hypothetical protein